MYNLEAGAIHGELLLRLMQGRKDPAARSRGRARNICFDLVRFCISGAAPIRRLSKLNKLA